MALAFVPGLPTVEFEPELALALFLPPLLQLSAYRTDFPRSGAISALAFVGGAVGGAAIGWVLGRVAMRVLEKLDDTLHDITASVLTGFATYFAAEAVHVSGVIAVVACGFVLGRQQHHKFTARTRLELKAVWSFIEFVLTSLVFMLIGLQLSGIIERLERYDWTRLGLLALATSAALIVSRFA